MKEQVGLLACSLARVLGMCQPQTLQAKERSLLRDFSTYLELESWFQLHTELRMPEPNLCDDYARESRALAELDGYHLGLCLVFDGKAYGTQVMAKDVYHVGNMAIVLDDQEVYYVDLAWNILTKLCNFYKGGKY